MLEERFDRLTKKEAVKAIANEIITLENTKSSRVMKAFLKLCRRFEKELDQEDKKAVNALFGGHQLFAK